MTQYEAIGRRIPSGVFQMTAIDPHIMKQINCFIQTLAPLHPQAAYRIAVVEAYNTQKACFFKGMFLVAGTILSGAFSKGSIHLRQSMPDM